MRTYSTLPHCNANLLAGVDFETTGAEPGYHEIVQIAIVPLNSDFEPSKEIRPFYQTIKPHYPERADPKAMRVHGISMADLLLDAPDQERVADMVDEWFMNIDLPCQRNLVPVVWNWAFESAFGKAWLGLQLFDKIFHSHARDGMLLALSLNDRAFYAGDEKPFNGVGLKSVSEKYRIVNPNPHDSLADAVTGARAYRAMLKHEML